MQCKEGNGWKAWSDDINNRFFGEYGGCQSYHLYELTAEQYARLCKGMTESAAADIMYEGRHLYMSVNDRCGPPYTVVFDDDYKTLCPWANVVGAEKSGPIRSPTPPRKSLDPKKATANGALRKANKT